MKRPRHTVQLGCLTLLLLWAVLGAILQLSGAWSNQPPGDDEGGGPFAAIGIAGFILFVVIFGIAGAARAIAARLRRAPRGFPIEPAAPKTPEDRK